VQGIARGASCNVALMYRHWASKRALYLDILRAVWLGAASEILRVLEGGPASPSAVVGAYLDAMMRDPMGAQILIREYLDGGPFLRELAEKEPELARPVVQAATSIQGSNGHALRAGVDPLMAVMTIGALASLAASAKDAATPFFGENAPTDEAWKRHLSDLLLNGLLAR
jgi:AcrR family transcriptional regulator